MGNQRTIGGINIKQYLDEYKKQTAQLKEDDKNKEKRNTDAPNITARPSTARYGIAGPSLKLEKPKRDSSLNILSMIMLTKEFNMKDSGRLAKHPSNTIMMLADEKLATTRVLDAPSDKAIALFLLCFLKDRKQLRMAMQAQSKTSITPNRNMHISKEADREAKDSYDTNGLEVNCKGDSSSDNCSEISNNGCKDCLSFAKTQYL